MFYYVSIIFLGIFIYIKSYNRLLKIEYYIKNMPSTNKIRTLLDDSFTGYILCVTPMFFQELPFQEDLKKIIEENSHELITINASSVFTNDISIMKDLNVTQFPALVSVKGGKAITVPLIIRDTDKEYLVNIEQFVKDTKKVLD
ncbi:hypothetical protein QIH01_04620 [Brevibacillus brevis]|nr:hypothetical protein QIH01_04620 [Brevibacillus brevis]